MVASPTLLDGERAQLTAKEIEAWHRLCRTDVKGAHLSVTSRSGTVVCIEAVVTSVHFIVGAWVVMGLLRATEKQEYEDGKKNPQLLDAVRVFVVPDTPPRFGRDGTITFELSSWVFEHEDGRYFHYGDGLDIGFLELNRRSMRFLQGVL